MATQKKHHKRKNLANSDPGKILDLVMNLYEDTCAQLQLKINHYFMEECDAELAFLIVVNAERMEAYIEAVGSMILSRKFKIYMTKQLCDVVKTSREHNELLSSLGSDLQAIVTPFIKECKDNQMLKKRVLMVSEGDKPFSVIVCLLTAKVPEENAAILIRECFLFIWPTLKKAIILEYETTLKHKCQQLLRVARRLFIQVASLGTLLQIAMQQAKLLTNAEYCSVKLVDVDRMQLYELPTITPGTADGEQEGSERRFPMDAGIAGLVVRTGRLVNARCATEHRDYDKDIDTVPGVECRTLLCFPIREQSGIIGVGQLINKVGDPYFDCTDEEMALAFSIYCGVCIMHSVVYRKVQEAHVRNTLANELIMYHMKVSDAEVSRVLSCGGYHAHPHLASLHLNPRALPARELPCYVLRMFAELGLDTRFQINSRKLSRFVLHAKKGYRDVPYHGWLHAFNVTQFAFAALVNFKLVKEGYFNELQGLMYVVAGLLHDIDHRGTTNSFHLQGQTTLAALYSSEGSVMERHHLAQAMCILNTEGCDILEALPRRDYDRAIIMLKDFILASDLANYFKNMQEYKAISREFQRNNRAHAAALQALLMNAADLSDQLKDWGSVKKTAAAVLTEFFKQGELEKSRGDLPAITMDRDKCFIPELEIQFLNTTCIPLFEMLGRIIPKAQPIIKIVENHMERWDAAKPVFAEVPYTAGMSVLLSPELDNLIEINLQEKERRLREEAAAAAAGEAAGEAGEGAADNK